MSGMQNWETGLPENTQPCSCPVDARITQSRKIQAQDGAREILTFTCPKCGRSWERSFT